MIHRRRVGTRTEVRLVFAPWQQKILNDAASQARSAEMQLEQDGIAVPAEVANALQELRIRARELLVDPLGLLLTEDEHAER